MRTISIAILAVMLAGCGGGGVAPADTTTDPDAPADSTPDTTPDTTADDVAGEVECTSDGDCDDSDPCTTDACDPGSNECQHGPVDADGDGSPAASVAGTACTGGTDCDDEDTAIRPGIPEVRCDGVDENCDGSIDNADGSGDYTLTRPCSNTCGEGAEPCTASGWAACGAEGSRQCFDGTSGCTSGSGGTWTCTGSCLAGTQSCADATWSECTGDVLPTEEACGDGLDTDCDGWMDEEGASGCTTYYLDGDGDGHGAPTDSRCLCGPTLAYTATVGDDCDDGNAGVWDGDWYDPASGYVWEDPPMAGGGNWDSAVSYCAGLSLCGHGAGEWHLPTISELRTLLRGCPATEDGGACGVTDSCLGSSCWSDSCNDCTPYGGPGSGGCYWEPAVEGTCSTYWSSSSLSDGTSNAWGINFHSADVDSYPKFVAGHAVCVRPGP